MKVPFSYSITLSKMSSKVKRGSNSTNCLILSIDAPGGAYLQTRSIGFFIRDELDLRRAARKLDHPLSQFQDVISSVEPMLNTCPTASDGQPALRSHRHIQHISKTTALQAVTINFDGIPGWPGVQNAARHSISPVWRVHGC